MKVRSPSVARGIALLCAAVWVNCAASSALAAGVVGTGTAASCTDAALDAAVAGGGLVTFDCGPAPATIDISTGTGTKTIGADTTIDGGGLITISRREGGFPPSPPLFVVASDAGFTVRNLTIANTIGGGIRNDNGTLTATGCTFSGNSDAAILNNGGAVIVTDCTFSDNSGGGIRNDNGTLTATGSTFSGNSGGIVSGGGTLTVADCTFSGNSGGIVSSDGPLTVSDSIFSGNSDGGIVNRDGPLTVSDSTFTRNSIPDGSGGAGIAHAATQPSTTLTVANSTFSENSGGGINFANDGGAGTVTNSTFTTNSVTNGGGAIFAAGVFTVSSSTFNGNSATNGQANGGAIFGAGTLIVSNSTFTANSATVSGGAIWSNGTLTVANSTITANSVTNVGAGVAYVSSLDGSASLFNTIVAGNTGCATPACNCGGDAITDGGHNLEDSESCGFSAANGSLSNTDPMLAPTGLANNGGPTQTIALGPDSPAIDAGDLEVCANSPVNGVDQRGFVRPGTGHTSCAIGAYEADAVPPPCVGDCDGNGVVAINELILGVNIVLELRPVDACTAFMNSEGVVDIAQLIKGVNVALNGCPYPGSQGFWSARGDAAGERPISGDSVNSPVINNPDYPLDIYANATGRQGAGEFVSTDHARQCTAREAR